MTNRDAIDILRRLAPPRTSKKHFDDFIQARDMAINSLSQPERIKGHWICDRSWSEGVGMGESYGHYWKCDKCGHLEKSNGGVCGCNFCSNCGSYNREETE